MSLENWHVRLNNGAILHFDTIESTDTAPRDLVGEPVKILVGNSGLLYRGPRRVANVLVWRCEEDWRQDDATQ